MTKDINALIDSLAEGAGPVRPMLSPARLLLALGGILLVYVLATGCFMGLRPDLAAQLHRPLFLTEILLLLALVASSLTGAIYLAFPDQYQHPFAAKLPLYLFAAFLVLLAVQAFLPGDPRMVMPPPEEAHGMSCTTCIGLVALIPSALMFVLLKGGASAQPPLSGAYIVLAAASIGCLIIRLEEANDSLLHLALWHYLPALVFAAIGACIGKFFLKW